MIILLIIITIIIRENNYAHISRSFRSTLFSDTGSSADAHKGGIETILFIAAQYRCAEEQMQINIAVVVSMGEYQ